MISDKQREYIVKSCMNSLKGHEGQELAVRRTLVAFESSIKIKPIKTEFIRLCQEYLNSGGSSDRLEEIIEDVKEHIDVEKLRQQYEELVIE